MIDSLPLFPLSDVVLLPEVSIPLRIFEPRYRQMTRDVLAGSHQIGMVTVRPDRVREMAGDPPIFDVGCLGRVAHAEEEPDGLFQIVLLGVSRFRIVEEDPRGADRLYRCARVELLSDDPPQASEDIVRLENRRDELMTLLERLVSRVDANGARELATSAFERLEPAHLINALTQSIALQPVERQQLLEANSILHRFEIMCDLLCFRLAEVTGGASGSSPLAH